MSIFNYSDICADCAAPPVECMNCGLGNKPVHLLREHVAFVPTWTDHGRGHLCVACAVDVLVGDERNTRARATLHLTSVRTEATR